MIRVELKGKLIDFATADFAKLFSHPSSLNQFRPALPWLDVLSESLSVRAANACGRIGLGGRMQMKVDLASLKLSKESWAHFAEMRAKSAQEDGNPVLMLEAILTAAEFGAPLPPVAYDFLITALRKWYGAQATVSLDEAFGLKSSTGKRHPYRMLLLQDRNEMLFDKIAIAKALGAKTAQAAEMAVRGLEDHKHWNQSKWDLPPKLEVETLLRSYSKWPARAEMERLHREAVSKWTTNDKRKFLRIFPSDCIPYRVKLEPPKR